MLQLNSSRLSSKRLFRHDDAKSYDAPRVFITILSNEALRPAHQVSHAIARDGSQPLLVMIPLLGDHCADSAPSLPGYTRP